MQKNASTTPERAVGEPQRGHRAVLGGVGVHGAVGEATHGLRPGRRTFRAGRCSARPCPSASRRRPVAGSCRHAPGIGGYQQESWARAKTGWPSSPSRMSLQRRLVLGVEAHHERRAQPHAGLRGTRRSSPRLGHGQAQRLLAEHVLARPGAGQRLLAMHVRRRGDVDGVDVAAAAVPRRCRRPRRRTGAPPRRWLPALTSKTATSSALRGRHDAFGNGAAPGDAAGADHAPFDRCAS